MKLTQPQLNMLAEASEFGYLPGRGSQSARVGSRLEKMGLVGWVRGEVTITEAGREALSTEAGQAAVKVAAEKAKGDHYAKKARDHEDLVAELARQGIEPTAYWTPN